MESNFVIIVKDRKNFTKGKIYEVSCIYSSKAVLKNDLDLAEEVGINEKEFCFVINPTKEICSLLTTKNIFDTDWSK